MTFRHAIFFLHLFNEHPKKNFKRLKKPFEIINTDFRKYIFLKYIFKLLIHQGRYVVIEKPQCSKLTLIHFNFFPETKSRGLDTMRHF